MKRPNEPEAALTSLASVSHILGPVLALILTVLLRYFPILCFSPV